MSFSDLIKLLVVCSVIVLPALAITARFALKPIVDALLRLKEGGVLPTETAGALRDATLELQQLRAEVAEMKGEVARLQDVQSFHAALGEARESPALSLPR